jgi:hypothetical protein
LNGIVISQVPEQRPEEIDKPVYLSASLLPSGKSAIEASPEDTESVILKSVEMDEAQGKITLTEEGKKDALYHDCPQEDFERAGRLISPQPLSPFGTPVQLMEVFEGVRRACGGPTCTPLKIGLSALRLRRGCLQSCRVRRSSRWRPGTCHSSPRQGSCQSTSTTWQSCRLSFPAYGAEIRPTSVPPV